MNHSNTANSALYPTEVMPPAQPLSSVLQANLNVAINARNTVGELRGRMFGFPPPSVVGEGKNSEPHTTEDVALATSRVLDEVFNVLCEINSRL